MSDHDDRKRHDTTDEDRDDRHLAADSDDVAEFVEQLVEEPGAPMNEEGIINNP